LLRYARYAIDIERRILILFVYVDAAVMPFFAVYHVLPLLLPRHLSLRRDVYAAAATPYDALPFFTMLMMPSL